MAPWRIHVFEAAESRVTPAGLRSEPAPWTTSDSGFQKTGRAARLMSSVVRRRPRDRPRRRRRRGSSTPAARRYGGKRQHTCAGMTASLARFRETDAAPTAQ